MLEEARAVLDRLERIEELDRAGASRSLLVAELRALLTEAEAWAATEGDDAGRRAAESLRSALETCGERSAREMIAM